MTDGNCGVTTVGAPRIAVYEGWLIHDLVVPSVASPRSDGHAAFGTITADDAMEIAEMERLATMRLA